MTLARVQRSPELWPTKPPPGQEGKPATIVSPPREDLLDFVRHKGPGLVTGVGFGWLPQLFKTLLNSGLDELDDQKMLDLFFDTIFSRFVTTTLDPGDERIFAAQIATRQPDEVDFKLDFSAMRRLNLMPGIYAAATVSLGRISSDGSRRLVAIRINDLVLLPDDPAWPLARYFVMQGAGLHAVLPGHTSFHFQYDAIHGISRAVLPEGHSVLEALRPHLRFTLALNMAALHSNLSILTNNQLFPFSTFPCDSKSVHHFQSTGYTGIVGNSAYPEYRFHRRPPKVFGDLGVFLGRYYETVLAFTTRVAATIAPDDAAVAGWAASISEWVKGFPNQEEIREPGALAETLASIIWGITIVHSTEHYGLIEDIPLGSIPMRLRVPPPYSRQGRPWSRSQLVRYWDTFRQRMAWEVLIRDNAVNRIESVRYDFRPSELQTAGQDFVASLRRTEVEMPVRRFAPLSRIAQGIQF